MTSERQQISKVKKLSITNKSTDNPIYKNIHNCLFIQVNTFKSSNCWLRKATRRKGEKLFWYGTSNVVQCKNRKCSKIARFVIVRKSNQICLLLLGQSQHGQHHDALLPSAAKSTVEGEAYQVSN